MTDKSPRPPTINGSFTFKGEKAYLIASDFFAWCRKMEEEHGAVIDHNRVDYNSPIHRS